MVTVPAPFSPSTVRPAAGPSRTALVRRARRMNRELAELYPDAHCELDFSSPLELLVATILSAQCTDKRVNQVTPVLFARYRTAADYAAADRDELEKIIRSDRLLPGQDDQHHRARAGAVRPVRRRGAAAAAGPGHAARRRQEDRQRRARQCVRRTRASPSIPISAGSPGGSAGRRPDDPEKIEQEVGALFPRSEWTMLSHRLIWHGRRVCHSRRPACGACGAGPALPIVRRGPDRSASRPEAGQGRPLLVTGEEPRDAGADVPGWLADLARSAERMPVPAGLRPPPAGPSVGDPDPVRRRPGRPRRAARRSGAHGCAGTPASRPFPAGRSMRPTRARFGAALREAAEEALVDPAGVQRARGASRSVHLAERILGSRRCWPGGGARAGRAGRSGRGQPLWPGCRCPTSPIRPAA